MSVLAMEERGEAGVVPGDAEPPPSAPGRMEMEEVELRAWEDLCRAAVEAGAEGLEAVRTGLGGVLFAPSPGMPGLNRAFGLPPGRVPLPELASALVGAFQVRGIPRFRLQLLPGVLREADVQALQGLGYRPLGRTARLYRPAGDAPWVLTGLEVVDAAAEHAPALRAMGPRGPDASDPAGAWLATALGRPGWRVLVALDQGRPVAAGAVHVQGAWGWIGLSTDGREHRGPEVRHALLAELVLQGTRRGCRHLVMEVDEAPVGDVSRARAAGLGMGFREVYLRTTWLYEAPRSAGGPGLASRVFRWLRHGQVGVGSVKP